MGTRCFFVAYDMGLRAMKLDFLFDAQVVRCRGYVVVCLIHVHHNAGRLK